MLLSLFFVNMRASLQRAGGSRSNFPAEFSVEEQALHDARSWMCFDHFIEVWRLLQARGTDEAVAFTFAAVSLWNRFEAEVFRHFLVDYRAEINRLIHVDESSWLQGTQTLDFAHLALQHPSIDSFAQSIHPGNQVASLREAEGVWDQYYFSVTREYDRFRDNPTVFNLLFFCQAWMQNRLVRVTPTMGESEEEARRIFQSDVYLAVWKDIRRNLDRIERIILTELSRLHSSRQIRTLSLVHQGGVPLIIQPLTARDLQVANDLHLGHGAEHIPSSSLSSTHQPGAPSAGTLPRYESFRYRVAVITALKKERIAVRATFSKLHAALPTQVYTDFNSYTLGQIGNHFVVLTSLDLNNYGEVSAAVTTTHVRHSFPNIDCCIMVGIAGGIPAAEPSSTSGRDIRLGDVLVSVTEVSVIDQGKTLQSGHLHLGPSRSTNLSQKWKNEASSLETELKDDDYSGLTLQDHINELLRGKPELLEGYQRPTADSDHLYISSYSHSDDEQKHELSCQERGCDSAYLLPRPPRHPSVSRVFSGVICTGNTVIKSSKVRDELRNQRGAIGMEMEAAGVAMGASNYFVIRGVCDYADSHKNKLWQEYAALAAAAYLKQLLGHVPASDDVA